jgi:hypothetical protein
MMSTLQQLQQSDPAKYQQVTKQIATNLTSAAQTAEAGGNTTAANQLNQLAADFTNASQSGQLPNVRDLATISVAATIIIISTMPHLVRIAIRAVPTPARP